MSNSPLDFVSKATIDKESFIGISDIGFATIKKAMLLCSLIVFISTCLQLFLYLSYGIFSWIITFLAALVLGFMAIRYFDVTHFASKRFEQLQFLYARKTFYEEVSFSDKITVHSLSKTPAEVFYTSVKQIFSFKNYIILLLENDIYLTVQKSPEECYIEGESLTEYLLSECPNLKTPKVKPLGSEKSICTALLVVASILLAIAIFSPSVISFIKEYLAERLIYLNALN